MMKKTMQVGMMLVLLITGLCPDLFSLPEGGWQGILLSKTGRDRYRVSIEVIGLSSAAEIDELDRSRRFFDRQAFLGLFESRSKGVLRVSSTKVIAIRAAVKKAVGDGWRYLLVAKNGIAEPGVKKELAYDRFLVIELVLDDSLSGEGKIYENADVDFSGHDLRITSTPTIPRMILNLKAVKKAMVADTVENLMWEQAFGPALRFFRFGS